MLEKPIGQWTIHDIARVAGVSAKTVSRVANNEAGVSAATRAQVARIIEDVGYQPHTGARSMRSRQRDCLGITVSETTARIPVTRSFLIRLFDELYRVFGRRQIFLCWDLNPPELESGLDYGRGLWQQRFGGCLIVGPLSKTDRTIPRIHASGSPYLTMSRLDSIPDLSYATVDYEEGSYLSAKFLLERGHKKVAMLMAFRGYQAGEERRRGYFRALEEAGVVVDEALIRSVSFGTTDLITAVHRLLQDPSVTGLIDCSATEDSASIREGARRAGRTLGKDVDVVTWTYTPDAVVLPEASAHVWLPVREAMAEGLELLGSWLNGDGPQQPIQLLYHPTLYQTPLGKEAPPPRHLFVTHD